jgi:deferrochelatase/peroxidase EfeB
LDRKFDGSEKAVSIEPFGFRDGISQPGIRGFTSAVVNNDRLETAEQPGSPIIAAGEFILGHVGEGGTYPDVNRSRTPEWMCDGSFQVFLRLRQDVEGWHMQMSELTASSTDTIDAGATAIGRYENGVPLEAPRAPGGYNDFTFDGPTRQRTPRFAHICKMYPRNGTFDDRIHRLLRRGIPFDTPLRVEERLPYAANIADDADERGLAFNAFMASIENQFEYLLQNWASNPQSLPPVAADGPDPVVGTSDAPCVVHRAGGQPLEIHFGKFVWTSGAVYAFAPSLETLQTLANL